MQRDAHEEARRLCREIIFDGGGMGPGPELDHIRADYLETAEEILCEHVEKRATEWRRDTGADPGLGDLQRFAENVDPERLVEETIERVHKRGAEVFLGLQQQSVARRATRPIRHGHRRAPGVRPVRRRLSRRQSRSRAGPSSDDPDPPGSLGTPPARRQIAGSRAVTSAVLACERCGVRRREILPSSWAGARVCLSCHLHATPTVGTDPELLSIAAKVRNEEEALSALAAEIGADLASVAARLRPIPLLLEVGSKRESPAELLAAASDLRSEAIRLLERR